MFLAHRVKTRPVILRRVSVCSRRPEGVGVGGQDRSRQIPALLLHLLLLQGAALPCPTLHLLSDAPLMDASPPQELEDPQMSGRRDVGPV